MDTTAILAVIDELNELGVLSLTIAGGEPLLRQDAFTILSHACSLPGWSVTVITNGTFMSEALVARLERQCPSLRINISVDGSTPDRFDYMRHGRRRDPRARKALFETVMAGLRRTVSSELRDGLQVNFTLSAANRDDLFPTYQMVTELGAPSLLAIKYFPAGRGLDQMDEMEFDYPVWADYFRELTKAKADGRLSGLYISLPSAWEFYLPFRDAGIDLEWAESVWRYRAPLRQDWFRHQRTVGDPSGMTDLNVLANGDVYPVTLMSGNEKVKCGNVSKSTLENIWHESTVLHQLRTLTSADLHHICQSCPILDICGGGSRARAISLGSHVKGPDLACPMLHDEAST